ncbi:MAG TPA: response regulator [Vulgatibacter sp.]|nr:response regulator [Vulgatibacter sp.]
MRVLIIESDLAFASTLRQALEARGVEVETTADGKRGVELAHEKRPAAVVLAVELGDRLTGGFTWCNKFKRDESLKTIPLLLTSSLATEQTFDQHRKLKTRADDYLLKPFGPRDLLDRLEPYLPRPPAPADGDGTVDLVGELLAGLDDDAPTVNGAVRPAAMGDGEILDVDPDSNDDRTLETGDGLDDDESVFDAAASSEDGVDPDADPADEAGITLDADPNAEETAGVSDDGSSIDVEDDFDILAADLVDELEFASAGPDAALAAALSAGPVTDNPWPDATPSPGIGFGAGRLAELETRLATLAAELEASRKGADELRAQLGVAHTDLAMSKGEAIALQERLSSLEAELADQKDRGELLARRLELEESARAELRAALANALARLDSL